MALRIKDSIDLKELEKFGFKRKKAYDDTYFYEKINLNIQIYIFESRKISISIRYTNGEYITLKNTYSNIRFNPSRTSRESR